MIRVLLVDDQAMIRVGLAGILSDAGLEVCGEASHGAEALLLASRLRPDVVLMDLRMPVLDGVAAITRLRGAPETERLPVLVLTTFDGDDDVLAALRAGADGFLSKAADASELVAAIQAVAGGAPAVSPAATRALMRNLAATGGAAPPDPELVARVATLTARERDMVIAAAEGRDNAQIARALHISPHTVKTHLNRAMVKLDARDRGQLVAAAYRAGLAGR